MKRKIQRVGELYEKVLVEGKYSPYDLFGEFHPYITCGGFPTHITQEHIEREDEYRIGYFKIKIKDKKQAKKLHHFQNNSQYNVWLITTRDEEDNSIIKTEIIIGGNFPPDWKWRYTRILKLYHFLKEMKQFIPGIIQRLEINLLDTL